MGIGMRQRSGAKGSTRWERVSMAARNAGARHPAASTPCKEATRASNSSVRRRASASRCCR